VLNDPDGLAQAMNKLYLLGFPGSARPRTLVTRDRDRIVGFLEEEGRIVVKPLAGYGGSGVFVVDAGDTANLDGILRAVSRDGYVVAQAYLPAAEAGDLRLFLLEGRPLRRDGRYAAVFRRRTGTDLRSNVQVGGRPEAADVDDGTLAIAEALRARLEADGMFLVGLDLVGDKVMEINVFSPGGLSDAGQLLNVDFVREVREAIERRVNAASR
jgi:glutathione synthase